MEREFEIGMQDDDHHVGQSAAVPDASTQSCRIERGDASLLFAGGDAGYVTGADETEPYVLVREDERTFCLGAVGTGAEIADTKAVQVTAGADDAGGAAVQYVVVRERNHIHLHPGQPRSERVRDPHLVRWDRRVVRLFIHHAAFQVADDEIVGGQQRPKASKREIGTFGAEGRLHASAQAYVAKKC